MKDYNAATRSIGRSAIILYLVLFLLPSSIFSQDKLTCTDLKDGIFYTYPKNSDEYYLIRRVGEFQYETNLKTADTAVWKINWTDDCTYTLKYISRQKVQDAATNKLLKKHKFAFEITKVNNDYYVYKAFLDNTNGDLITIDTIWMSEKISVVNNLLYKKITDESILKKEHFSDTSKYAVLYVYRPGKTTNSLSNYLVYFDNNLMCVAKNRTGYIFKVLKEGEFTLSSKLYKDESSLKVDVKFGKVYYVKSMINWGITSRLYNFKLEMAAVDAVKGKEEFEKITVQ